MGSDCVSARSGRPANPPLKFHVTLRHRHFALLPRTLIDTTLQKRLVHQCRVSRQKKSTNFLRSDFQNLPLIWHGLYTFTAVR
jgi:hypothetical protein